MDSNPPLTKFNIKYPKLNTEPRNPQHPSPDPPDQSPKLLTSLSNGKGGRLRGRTASDMSSIS